MPKCLFCQIIAGDIPAKKISENDHLIVFADINPQAPLHCLIVPRKHIATLNDLSEEDDGIVGEMVRQAASIARERGYADEGYRTVFNTNAGAGQTVFHIHLHLLAGRRFSWPPG
jgi:histidine triad (HIT) family protein